LRGKTERDNLHCQRHPFFILNECRHEEALTIVPSVAQLHPSLSDANARFTAAIVLAMGSECRMKIRRRKHEHDPYLQ